MISTTVAVVALSAIVGLSPAQAQSASVAQHGLGARRPNVHKPAPLLAADDLPASVDLRQWAMTPGNQGQVGSCVTWAINYGMLGWYFNKAGRSGPPFAPMYTYSQINGGADNGSYPTQALLVAQQQGSDTRADYTQGDYNWWDHPTDAERLNAAHYKIAGYQTLFAGEQQAGSIAAIKNALVTNHPVAIMFPVRHGFDYLDSSADAVDDDTTTTNRGYHEVLAVAYDAAGLIIENSWGTWWGNGGFGRLSWNVVYKDVYEADIATGLAPEFSSPSVSTPTVAVATSGTTTGALVPYKVSWTGTAGSAGPITSYDVSYQRDGGAAIPVTLASPTATSVTLNVSAGHTYRVAVQAHADQDTQSSVKYSESFKPTLAQETDSRVVYAGKWSASSANAASGSKIKVSNATNAKATLTAAGKHFSWIASRGPDRGSARVYVDGALKATMNTYLASASSQRIEYSINFSAAGKHTIAIVNLGSPGHPRVDVDAFLISS